MTDNLNPHERDMIMHALEEKASENANYAALHTKLLHAERDGVRLTLRQT